MSLSDAERDALEQLQEAIESGDLSLLRKLLNQMPALEAMEFLQERMQQTDTNEDFLNSMSEPVL